MTALQAPMLEHTSNGAATVFSLYTWPSTERQKSQ
jgi:hypothetical protein